MTATPRAGAATTATTATTQGSTVTGLKESIESARQLTVAWRAMVLDRDADADVRDLPGIAVRWADSPFSFWNCVTLTDQGAGPELLAERLGQAADIMRAKKNPGFLWLFEDLLDEEARTALAPAAERAGFEHAFPGTARHLVDDIHVLVIQTQSRLEPQGRVGEIKTEVADQHFAVRADFQDPLLVSIVKLVERRRIPTHHGTDLLGLGE